MGKIAALVITLVILLSNVKVSFASNENFVSVVNPVRGEDFWNEDFDIWKTTQNQIELLNQKHLEATFLLRPDVLIDPKLSQKAYGIPGNFEKGLFMEITPSWAKLAGVSYHLNTNWHDPGSVFLSGYSTEERIKLIDTAFAKYKEIFGNYPRSVGAWWIDAYSLSYMNDKYNVSAALIVADQYSTDGYQVWGQYFGYPYYPAKNNTLFPAQTVDKKLPVVVMQWAARDPVNGYGKAVEESTLSLQANDYSDYHDLGTDYFRHLLESYLDQPLNQINQVVVGLENSYDYGKYGGEYQRQIETLENMQSTGYLKVWNMGHFADKYSDMFPEISPSQVIFSSDPMGGNKKAVWFMDPYYRAGWIWDGKVAMLRDVRQYIEDQAEICFSVPCPQINFATGAIRVLDLVTNGLSYTTDEGMVTDVKFNKLSNGYLLSYTNLAGKKREILFLPRDIAIDSKIFTIDSLILNAQMNQTKQSKTRFGSVVENYSNSLFELGMEAIKFGLFFIFAVMLPGFGISRLSGYRLGKLGNIMLVSSLGLVGLVLIDYFLTRFWVGWLYVYLTLGVAAGVYQAYRQKLWRIIEFNNIDMVSGAVILAGSIFWCFPVWRSGMLTKYGMGFWGPNGHDGIWHLAVSRLLQHQIPPENPIFSGTLLKNYHYLYDVLLAVTHHISGISLIDLLFRFYPIIFGLFIGIGFWIIGKSFKFKQITLWLSLILVYFSGSFGWIVEYARSKTFSGESAFWVNQPISTNLNPPFAFSLVITEMIFILFININKKSLRNILVLGILTASLIGIKIYAFILLVGVLGVFGIIRIIKKDLSYLYWLAITIFGGLAILIPNYELSAIIGSSLASGTFIWSPWWFVHTMVDYPDRVGWLKLAQARVAYFERGEWFKYIGVEILGLIIFLVGNLGMRIMMILGLFQLHRVIRNEKVVFIGLFCLLGILIPLFFIQSGTAWNTIQFFYYALPFSAMAAAWSVTYLRVLRLPITITGFMLVVIAVVGSINTLERAQSYLINDPHAVIPFGELDGLKLLKSMNYGTVLTMPYDDHLKDSLSTPWPLLAYDSTAYVSAISGLPVYVADDMQNQILGNDYIKRRVAAKDFFSAPNREFLVKNKISYLYLPKVYGLTLPKEQLKIEEIMSNNEVIIYKVL